MERMQQGEEEIKIQVTFLLMVTRVMVAAERRLWLDLQFYWCVCMCVCVCMCAAAWWAWHLTEGDTVTHRGELRAPSSASQPGPHTAQLALSPPLIRPDSKSACTVTLCGCGCVCVCVSSNVLGKSQMQRLVSVKVYYVTIRYLQGLPGLLSKTDG